MPAPEEDRPAFPAADPFAGGWPAPTGGCPTMGVEEEFLLLDPETGLPVEVAGAVLASARDGSGEEDGSDLQRELIRAQVETASPVCGTLPELQEHLMASRTRLLRAAEQQGVVLAAVGAAPIGQPGSSVTPTERYLRMREVAPALIDEQLINGMHVHVAVPTRAAGVEALNRLRPSLHVLLALAGNSPLWRGEDSGFASWRSVHAQRWPVEGAPPFFDGAEDYDRRVEALLSTGAVLDRGMLYWQVWLSERYPTVEVRVEGVAIDVSTAVTFAGLVRALVMSALADVDNGLPAPDFPAELLRAAGWQAARHGVTGHLVDLGESPRGHPRLRPAADVVELQVERACAVLPPDERALVLAGVAGLLASGGGAKRQRHAMEDGGIPALLELIGDHGLGAGSPGVPGGDLAAWLR